MDLLHFTDTDKDRIALLMAALAFLTIFFLNLSQCLFGALFCVGTDLAGSGMVNKVSKTGGLKEREQKGHREYL